MKYTSLANSPANQLLRQGCQMVYFQTKYRSLGKFGRVLQWKMLVYFMVIWSILWPFGLVYGHFIYLMVILYMYFVVIWYIFPRFGILHQAKSGSPVLRQLRRPLRHSSERFFSKLRFSTNFSSWWRNCKIDREHFNTFYRPRKHICLPPPPQKKKKELCLNSQKWDWNSNKN
jgi:hypothetical protein